MKIISSNRFSVLFRKTDCLGVQKIDARVNRNYFVFSDRVSHKKLIRAGKKIIFDW